MPILRLLVILLVVSPLAACSSTTKSSTGDYETVPGEPGRDTERARRHHAEALDLIDKGDLEAAEASLKKALAADVTFGPAHNNLGKIYFQTDRLYLAAWEFQHAAGLMPYQPEPRYNLGLVLESAGKLDQAVDHYREALKIEPDNPVLIGNLARTKHRRGDRDAEQRSLLEQLVMKDSRPQWNEWAREQLARNSDWDR